LTFYCGSFGPAGVSDAFVLIGLQRRQVFRLFRRASSRTVPSFFQAPRQTTPSLPLRCAPWRCPFVAGAVCRFWAHLGGGDWQRHHGSLFTRDLARLDRPGLWRDRRLRLSSPHQPRRRALPGELVAN